MTTIYLLAEEVMRLLKGNPVISGRFKIEDVKLLVQHNANQLLKSDYFTLTLPNGETIPQNCMVYTYDNVPVTTYKTTKSKCTLPAIPISLPRNMGVLHISRTDKIDEPFIPIPTSMYGIIKPITLLGETSGIISYEVVGSDVIFNANLPGLNVNSVYMRLVGVDITSLSDNDILPLTSDLAGQVITNVYNILVQTPAADRVTTD